MDIEVSATPFLETKLITVKSRMRYVWSPLILIQHQVYEQITCYFLCNLGHLKSPIGTRRVRRSRPISHLIRPSLLLDNHGIRLLNNCSDRSRTRIQLNRS